MITTSRQIIVGPDDGAYERYTFSPAVEVDGVIWFSGCTAARRSPTSGRVVVEGDIVDQARTIYGKLETVARAGRMGLHKFVRIAEYVTHDALPSYGRLQEFRSSLFREHDPLVVTIAVDGLLRAGAVLEVEAIAQRARGVRDLSVGRAGDLAFISPTGVSRETIYCGDVEGQVKSSYDGFATVLNSCGMSLDSVIKITEFITPEAREQYELVQKVRRSYVPHPAVVTTVVMKRLVRPESSINIALVAALPNRRIARYTGRNTSDDEAVAVRVGSTILASGEAQVTRRDDESFECGGDIVEQSRVAYDDLAAKLAIAGAALPDAVQTVEFVDRRGLGSYKATACVRRKLLTRPYPAATGIVCTGFLDSNQLFRVDAVATHEANRE